MIEDTLVSVIIPTYKRADMLPRAIDSVLNQTYKAIEVIIVDDNNPETEYRKRTESLMARYENNNRVIYIKHDRNKNGATARNTGIKASQGHYIAFLDDDDIFYPQKIQKQVEYLNKHMEHDAVYCGIKFPKKIIQSGEEGNLTFNILSGKNLVYTITLLFRRSALESCGGWDESFRRNQEAALLLRFFSCGFSIGVIKDVLCEVDDSDRSNVLKQPVENEKEVEHYLNIFKDSIESCEKEKKGARKEIYSHRYLSVFLSYLKAGHFKGALIFYRRILLKYPISINKCLAVYTLKKIFT